jgi:histidine triad (HIT) family protein/ATP adenylyltransferase
VTAPPVRRPWDLEAYRARAQAACFICELLAGRPGYEHHMIHRDEVGVAFLARYPVTEGHVLVAPVDHREEVVEDVDEERYVALQRLVHRVGRAVAAVVPHERMYVLSFGSQAANAHVHWHVVPLPPGLPYEEQQAAFVEAAAGWLAFAEGDLAELAGRVRAELG